MNTLTFLSDISCIFAFCRKDERGWRFKKWKQKVCLIQALVFCCRPDHLRLQSCAAWIKDLCHSNHILSNTWGHFRFQQWASVPQIRSVKVHRVTKNTIIVLRQAETHQNTIVQKKMVFCCGKLLDDFFPLAAASFPASVECFNVPRWSESGLSFSTPREMRPTLTETQKLETKSLSRFLDVKAALQWRDVIRLHLHMTDDHWANIISYKNCRLYSSATINIQVQNMEIFHLEYLQSSLEEISEYPDIYSVSQRSLKISHYYLRQYCQYIRVTARY